MNSVGRGLFAQVLRLAIIAVGILAMEVGAEAARLTVTVARPGQPTGSHVLEDLGRIVLDRRTASGGATLAGRIVLARPLVTTLSVRLSSNSPAAQVPTSAVQIAPNQMSSEPFTVRTTAVTESVRLEISARLDTATLLPAAQFTPALLVLEPAILKSIKLSRTTVVGGSAEGTVKGVVELQTTSMPGF